MAYRLGIDLGTTNTVASLAADGEPVRWSASVPGRRRCGRCFSLPTMISSWWAMRLPIGRPAISRD